MVAEHGRLAFISRADTRRDQLLSRAWSGHRLHRLDWLDRCALLSVLLMLLPGFSNAHVTLSEETLETPGKHFSPICC